MGAWKLLTLMVPYAALVVLLDKTLAKDIYLALTPGVWPSVWASHWGTRLY